MRVIRSLHQMQALSSAWRKKGRSVGFVPTMGALHAGHLSLLRRARAENDAVVVSIFVNPSQFGPREDLSRYPRPFARDRVLCAREGADVLFAPSPAGMYPKGFDTWVEVERLSRPLCGAFRPGHFRGVATVVAKLFNLTAPTRAYFGMKDYQQWRVIQRMAQDLHMPVRVVACPTVREPGGLALSSRNAYLTAAERSAARNISLALRRAGELVKFRAAPRSARMVSEAKKILRRIPGARLEYVEVVDPVSLQPLSRVNGRALIAAALWLGKTRLIDNRIIGR